MTLRRAGSWAEVLPRCRVHLGCRHMRRPNDRKAISRQGLRPHDRSGRLETRLKALTFGFFFFLGLSSPCILYRISAYSSEIIIFSKFYHLGFLLL